MLELVVNVPLMHTTVPGLAARLALSSAAVVETTVVHAAPPVGGGVVTTPLGADTAIPVPALFVAATATRNVLATSLDCTTYVFDVRPATSEQFAPAASQVRHWYPYVEGEPDHVPGEATNVPPTVVDPDVLGGELSTGGLGGLGGPLAPPEPPTTPVGAENAVAVPAELKAVTTTRMVLPTSRVVSV
jgi:hypothetical protein